MHSLFGGDILECDGRHRVCKLSGGNESGAARGFSIVGVFHVRLWPVLGRKCGWVFKLRNRDLPRIYWFVRLRQLCFRPVYFGDGFERLY